MVIQLDGKFIAEVPSRDCRVVVIPGKLANIITDNETHPFRMKMQHGPQGRRWWIETKPDEFTEITKEELQLLTT